MNTPSPKSQKFDLLLKEIAPPQKHKSFTYQRNDVTDQLQITDETSLFSLPSA